MTAYPMADAPTPQAVIPATAVAKLRRSRLRTGPGR